jgi:hypothetical protein
MRQQILTATHKAWGLNIHVHETFAVGYLPTNNQSNSEDISKPSIKKNMFHFHIHLSPLCSMAEME